jgi:hypothetical protein
MHDPHASPEGDAMHHAHGLASAATYHEPAREQPLPKVDLGDLKELLAAGELATFKVPTDQPLFQWDLAEWERRFGDQRVNRHALDPRVLARLKVALTDAPEGKPLGTAGLFMKKERGQIFERTSRTFRELVGEMRKYAMTPLEPHWHRDIYSQEEFFGLLRRTYAYGVANSRTWKGFHFEYHRVYESWKAVFSFLWIGLSPGGIHYDPIDNTLLQLRGTKKILVFHPDLTDAVDGDTYPSKFNPTTFLSPTILESHRFMKFLPYSIVELKPGDGVTIPARAYHAPFACSHDSISLNSFLQPNLRSGPFPRDKRSRMRLKTWLLFRFSRSLYSLTGLKPVRLGPYEFV